MRLGLSWEFDLERSAEDQWRDLLAEARGADRMGFDSIWLEDTSSSIGSPTIVLTYLARCTSSIRLCAIRKRPRNAVVRVAEEIAVLDQFSRGRAGLAFEGVDVEFVEFTKAALAQGEFAFGGRTIRFPDDGRVIPEGVTRPRYAPYVPQWERGPLIPEFLAVTPKPYSIRVPLWSTDSGDDLPPLVRHGVRDEEAISTVQAYSERGDGESAIERSVDLERDSSDLVEYSRYLLLESNAQHLIFRRRLNGNIGELLRLASEVQPMLQA